MTTEKKHIKNLPRKKLFNLNCKQIRTNLQRLGQKLSKTPKDPYLSEQFFKLKRKYRNASRSVKRKFEQNILQKLETLQFTNNGGFWNLLKQNKGSNFDKQFSNEALSPVQGLSKHYKELLQNKYKPTIKQPKECKNFDSLNGDITIEEIKQTIKKLKNKKAPGNNSITNEMITCSDGLMLVKLEKLFNKIFKTGYYPNSWNEGLIFSIHKSGENENPNNY